MFHNFIFLIQILQLYVYWTSLPTSISITFSLFCFFFISILFVAYFPAYLWCHLLNCHANISSLGPSRLFHNSKIVLFFSLIYFLNLINYHCIIFSFWFLTFDFLTTFKYILFDNPKCKWECGGNTIPMFCGCFSIAEFLKNYIIFYK